MENHDANHCEADRYKRSCTSPFPTPDLPPDNKLYKQIVEAVKEMDDGQA